MRLSSFFRDKHGHIVIIQWPNVPLWIAIIFIVFQYLPIPLVQSISYWGVIVSLLYWSYLEIVDGVNTWRRVLGIVVALSQLLKLFKFI